MLALSQSALAWGTKLEQTLDTNTIITAQQYLIIV